MITHWDDLEHARHAKGHIDAIWTALTGKHSVTVGVNRIRVEPGMWSTPIHVEGSEEEIFYVIGGTGTSVQLADRAELKAFDVGPGDCLVHLPGEHAHSLRAGPEGLDVLAFGERHPPMGTTRLPRAGVAWGLGSWAPIGSAEDHPWRREAAAGAADVPAASPRPGRIVNIDAVKVNARDRTTVISDWRDIGTAAGSKRTGINHIRIHAGALMVPPHCHGAEEEIFVVLEGDGDLELWPSARYGGQRETFPVRAGSTVARPAGTHRAHTFRAGSAGMTVLAYGTRDPNDIVYYPRSGKISFRGVGVIGRLEQLDYWDGDE